MYLLLLILNLFVNPKYTCEVRMGGDLGEDWGDGPPKFEVGGTAHVDA